MLIQVITTSFNNHIIVTVSPCHVPVTVVTPMKRSASHETLSRGAKSAKHPPIPRTYVPEQYRPTFTSKRPTAFHFPTNTPPQSTNTPPLTRTLRTRRERPLSPRLTFVALKRRFISTEPNHAVGRSEDKGFGGLVRVGT